MATYFKDNHQGYTSKPVGNVEIDWSHEFVSGNTFVYNFLQPLSLLENYSVAGTPYGTLNPVRNTQYVDQSILESVYWIDSRLQFGSETKITIAWVGTIYSFPEDWGGIFTRTAADRGSNRFAIQRNGSTTVVRAYLRGAGNDLSGVTTATLSDGLEHKHVITLDGNTLRWYIDGILTVDQSVTIDTAADNGGTDATIWGAARDLTTGANQDFTVGLNVLGEAWSAEKAQRFAQNPYAFLKPAVPDYYALGAANDSGLTITADHVAAAGVVNQPVISAERLIAADHVASAEQVFAPAVASEILLAADYHAGNAAVYAPTLTQSGVAQTITADFVASGAAIHAATVASELLLAADHVAVSNTIYAPSVSRELLLSADYVGTGQQIYQPVAAIEIILSADAVASGAAVYSPIAVTSAQFLYAPYLTSSASVSDPAIRYKGWLNSVLGSQTWADVANSDNAYVDSVVNGKTWS